MKHYKVIRIKDNKIFHFASEDNDIFCTWLCREDKSIIKPLKDVRNYHNRFRKFIIGVDNDITNIWL